MPETMLLYLFRLRLLCRNAKCQETMKETSDGRKYLDPNTWIKQQKKTRRGTMRTHHPRSGTKGVKKRYNALEKGDRPCKKGTKGVKRVQWESTPSRSRTHHQRRGTKGVKKLQRESRPSRRRTRRSSEGVKQGHNESNLRKGGHKKGYKTLGKADTPSKKGHKGSQEKGTKGVKTLETIQEGVQRESRPSGRRTHHPTPRRTP